MMKHKKSVEISPFQITGEKNTFALANVGLQKYNEREKKMLIEDGQILVNDSESEAGDQREERKKEINPKIRKQKTAI